MPTITRFEEIEAWQTSRELTKLIYSFTEEAKFSRDFGLKHQIRRPSVTIISNISEGFENQTQAQSIRYLRIAKAFAMAEKASRQTARFISYLESHPQSKKSGKNLQNTSNLPTFNL